MTHALVLARDPNSGLGALYLDGELVWDFYSHDPLTGTLGSTNGWDDALEEMAARANWTFATESRHPIAYKSWTDYGWEWDTVWPDLLSDSPKPADPEADA